MIKSVWPINFRESLTWSLVITDHFIFLIDFIFCTRSIGVISSFHFIIWPESDQWSSGGKKRTTNHQVEIVNVMLIEYKNFISEEAPKRRWRKEKNRLTFWMSIVAVSGKRCTDKRCNRNPVPFQSSTTEPKTQKRTIIKWNVLNKMKKHVSLFLLLEFLFVSIQ